MEHHHGHHALAGGAIDPVCGMTVDPATARHKAAHSVIGNALRLRAIKVQN